VRDISGERPQIDIDISSFMPGNRAGGSAGDTYIVSGTHGHLHGGARSLSWRCFRLGRCCYSRPPSNFGHYFGPSLGIPDANRSGSRRPDSTALA
jgi:hypothetical protein